MNMSATNGMVLFLKHQNFENKLDFINDDLTE